MSGPVSVDDAPAVADRGPAASPCVEITESHDATVGRIHVRRALPRRGRRTVGAWCFADHMGPASVTENAGLDVGPHPHIGLQTVTWLIEGQVLHRDSLGNEQVIIPGQLNLMTAGDGVSHSEEATGHYRGELEGIQLWVAQPASTRTGDAAFQHHAELPRVALDRAVATVVIGDFASARSPARHDTALGGLDLHLLGGGTTLPLDPGWEYAIVVLRGSVALGRRQVEPGRLAYLGRGRDELGLDAGPNTRAVLLGGVPFAEQIVMWWNFVARSRDDLSAAYAAWQAQDDRFGRVHSPLPRIPAPPPYWTTSSA